MGGGSLYNITSCLASWSHVSLGGSLFRGSLSGRPPCRTVKNGRCASYWDAFCCQYFQKLPCLHLFYSMKHPVEIDAVVVLTIKTIRLTCLRSIMKQPMSWENVSWSKRRYYDVESMHCLEENSIRISCWWLDFERQSAVQKPIVWSKTWLFMKCIQYGQGLTRRNKFTTEKVYCQGPYECLNIQIGRVWRMNHDISTWIGGHTRKTELAWRTDIRL